KSPSTPGTAGSLATSRSSRPSRARFRAPRNTRWSRGLMAPGELRDLLGDGGLAYVLAAGVRGRCAERTAAEQPPRATAQDRLVSPRKVHGLFHPGPVVHGAAKYDRIVAELTDGFDWLHVDLQPGRSKLLRDALGDLPGGAVFACVCDKSVHDELPPNSSWHEPHQRDLSSGGLLIPGVARQRADD